MSYKLESSGDGTGDFEGVMGILVPRNVNHNLEINANNPYSIDVPAEQITGLVSYTHENGTSSYFRVGLLTRERNMTAS